VSLAAVERRIAALRAAVAPPPAIPDRLALFGLGFGEPDPWQAAVLTSEARQVALNCSRQSGKSVVAAALGLHPALASAGSLVLVVSPGERQSKLLFKRITALYRKLGEPVPADVDNKLSLELANGSEVHALPGKEGTIRGFAGVDLLLLDEASRIPDDVYAAVRPMLAVSGGRLVTLSTPWGKRGWWYEAWTNGGDHWQRFEVPAERCPRISAAFLAEERRALPPLVFDSEYRCKFVETEDAYFGHDDIAAAFASPRAPLFGEGLTDAA